MCATNPNPSKCIVACLQARVTRYMIAINYLVEETQQKVASIDNSGYQCPVKAYLARTGLTPGFHHMWTVCWRARRHQSPS